MRARVATWWDARAARDAACPGRLQKGRESRNTALARAAVRDPGLPPARERRTERNARASHLVILREGGGRGYPAPSGRLGMRRLHRLARFQQARFGGGELLLDLAALLHQEIGRTSWRESVCHSG